MPASSKKRASRRGADGKPVFAPFCAVFPAHLSHEAEASSCRRAGRHDTPALLAAAKTQLPDSEPALRACPKRKNLWQTIVMYPSDMIDEQWSAKALSGKQACRQIPGCAAPGYAQRHLLPSSMCKPQTINGARYPRTFHPGNRSAATPSPAAISAACGIRCWRQQVNAKAGGLGLNVAIIDIQSVKTVSKGDSADMTQAKRSKAR